MLLNLQNLSKFGEEVTVFIDFLLDLTNQFLALILWIIKGMVFTYYYTSSLSILLFQFCVHACFDNMHTALSPNVLF